MEIIVDTSSMVSFMNLDRYTREQLIDMVIMQSEVIAAQGAKLEHISGCINALKKRYKHPAIDVIADIMENNSHGT